MRGFHLKHFLVIAAISSAACGNAAPVLTSTDSVTAAPIQSQVLTPQAPPPATPVPATFDVAALADVAKPVVVNITTTQEIKVQQRSFEMMDPFEFFFGGPREQPRNQLPFRTQKRQALGTGFIIDPSGYVVTNEHVIHDADDVSVNLADEREFKAEIVGRDQKLDLALLKIKDAKDLPSGSLGSSEALRVGEFVLAVGNPFGLGHTVTLGIVSAKARSIGAGPYDDFIQTDASINPGNSGGPLFNWKGEIVGINTAIKAGASGIGFAIPIDALKEVLQQLREKGHVERGKLGLSYQPVSKDLASAMGLTSTQGALVTEVDPNGPAAKAGIQSGDLIVELDGVLIKHAEDLPRNVAKHAPGSLVKVGVTRNKLRKDVSVTLGVLKDEIEIQKFPSKDQSNSSKNELKLGATVVDAEGGGVAVVDVENGTSEFRPGDIIIEMNGTKIKNIQDLTTSISRAPKGSIAIVKVRRGVTNRYIAVPMGIIPLN